MQLFQDLRQCVPTDLQQHGQNEISKIAMQYQNKHFISRHKNQIFHFDKTQMKELCEEYFKKHPDLEPTTAKEVREFSFLQVQIPVLEAFFENKWKTKRAYEIDLKAQRTTTHILNQVMELSKFFFDLNYINEETCGLFVTRNSDIGNLESYVKKSIMNAMTMHSYSDFVVSGAAYI